MSKYEFRGTTLADSLCRAISPHHYNTIVKADSATCIRLEREILNAAQDLRNKESEIENLRAEIVGLRSSRFSDLVEGFAGIAVALSGIAVASTAVRAARLALTTGRISRENIISLVPIVGGLVSAARALRSAYNNNSAVEALAVKLENLSREFLELDLYLKRLSTQWAAGCEDPLQFVG